MNKKPTPSLVTAALVFEIALDGDEAQPAAPTRLRITPDGSFAAVDGRPVGMPDVKAKQWVMNPTAAALTIERFKSVGLDLPIDYEHQTLLAAKNGQEAPAAGWIVGLTYEPGNGLFVDVKWTAKGERYVTGKEYRYLSPVLLFDPETGEVFGLHSLALTNKPALNVLGAIAAATQQDLSRLPGLGRTTEEEPTMDKTKVLVALGLPLDTGDETTLTAIAALSQQNKVLEAKLVTLSANQFDPVKHIPLEEHKKVSEALAALSANQEKAKHEQLITAALSDGRILPPNEAYWRNQPLAALSEFLKDAKPLPALVGTQTQGQQQAGGEAAALTAAVAALSSEELAVCKSLGITAEAMAKTKLASAA